MADVIIPRGAENYVAIDLVSQHLKYQFNKRFQMEKYKDHSEIHNMNIKLINKEGSNEIKIMSKETVKVGMCKNLIITRTTGLI